MPIITSDFYPSIPFRNGHFNTMYRPLFMKEEINYQRKRIDTWDGDFIDLVTNDYFLVTVTVVLSVLMNAEVPLFSLKFKSFGIKENLLKYVFLLVSLGCIIWLHVIAIPLVILLYVILSIGNNVIAKKA